MLASRPFFERTAGKLRHHPLFSLSLLGIDASIALVSQTIAPDLRRPGIFVQFGIRESSTFSGMTKPLVRMGFQLTLNLLIFCTRFTLKIDPDRHINHSEELQQ
jgi:hypothetical protein